MATITPTALSSATSVTPAAASGGGDTVVVGLGNTVELNIVNGAGSDITVTLTAVKACDNGVLHDVIKTCTAGKTTPILIPAKCLTAAGNCAVAYSSATTITVYAVNTAT